MEAGLTELLYVADPMCSWCWGFAPVLEALVGELRVGVPLRHVMGGLAPDSDAPMDEATRAYVQDAWRAVAARTGARFEHRYWDHATPRRSTWPACRLVKAAGPRGTEVFVAIQRAYYLEARDVSDPAELDAIAIAHGLDPALRDAPDAHAALRADFSIRDELGAVGFPSLALWDGRHGRILTRGWVDLQTARAALDSAELLSR